MLRSVPLTATLGVICGLLTFGVHCGGGSGPSGFAGAQVKCQAAVGQLLDCCPDFTPGSLACDTTSFTEGSGCGSPPVIYSYPTLNEDESECILSQSCSSLVSTGVCLRASTLAASGPTQEPADGGALDAFDGGYGFDALEDASADGSECGALDADCEAPSDGGYGLDALEHWLTDADCNLLDTDGEPPSDGGVAVDGPSGDADSDAGVVDAGSGQDSGTELDVFVPSVCP
jgi:hypothetical protein